MWTKIYIAPVYLISFLVPKLKRTIKNYENLGDRRSIFLISSISGLLFSCVFYYIGDQLAVGGLAFVYFALFYLGSLLWGTYWLFLQSDYQSRINSGS